MIDLRKVSKINNSNEPLDELAEIFCDRDKYELFDKYFRIEHGHMSRASNQTRRSTRQCIERAVSLKRDVRIVLDGFENVRDHFFVNRPELSVLVGRFAHLNASRMVRRIAVLRRCNNEHVFETAQRGFFAQLVQKCVVNVRVILETKL